MFRTFAVFSAYAVSLAAPSYASAPTFTADVFPILQEKCHQCHRPNTIAPMSLLTYEEARPWAKAIRNEVVNRRMPPFYAEGPIGYYKDDLRLADEEIETIVSWVDSGANRGDPADLPERRVWNDPAWPPGDPDLVVEFPDVNVRQDGVDDLVNLFSEYVFQEDTWIRGAQIRIDTYSMLHHCSIFVVGPDDEIPENRKSREQLNVMLFQPLYTWFPGLEAPLLPEGQGMLIKKGSRIALRAHFAPTTEPVVERPVLGIYFANGVIDTPPMRVGVLITDLNLEPYDPEYTRRKIETFPIDGLVTHFKVHMHLRGKSSRIRLHYPDGASELIFDLPRYSFDWQRYYYLAEPKWVPAGTIAEFIATWDNSEANPVNPDPAAHVHWGSRTTDEMYGATIFYTPKLKLPETYIVKDGSQVDSYENTENVIPPELDPFARRNTTGQD